MASIKFDNLKKNSSLINQDYTYSDLHYDIVMDGKQRDIVLDYDDQAIKNSLIRIFNTIPGERFLFPKCLILLGRVWTASKSVVLNIFNIISG